MMYFAFFVPPLRELHFTLYVNCIYLLISQRIRRVAHRGPDGLGAHGDEGDHDSGKRGEYIKPDVEANAVGKAVEPLIHKIEEMVY